MENLNFIAIHHLVDVMPYDLLSKVTEAVEGNLHWSTVVEEHKKLRFSSRVFVGIPSEPQENEDEVLIAAKKSQYRTKNASYTDWDKKVIRHARLSCCIIRDVPATYRQQLETNGKGEEFYRLPPFSGLFGGAKCVPSTLEGAVHIVNTPTGEDLRCQPSQLIIQSTTKAQERLVTRLIEHLPKSFGEVDLIDIKDQPDLISTAVKHFICSTSSLRLRIRCEMHHDLFYVVADKFLEKSAGYFKCDMEGVTLNAEHANTLIDTWRDSDGECGEGTKQVSIILDRKSANTIKSKLWAVPHTVDGVIILNHKTMKSSLRLAFKKFHSGNNELFSLRVCIVPGLKRKSNSSSTESEAKIQRI